MVFLAEIRVSTESLLAGRWIGRNFGRIAQKSRASAHYFAYAPAQALIAAKDVPYLVDFRPLRECV